MKNIKFSRLFAAAMLVACFAFAGCKPQVEEVTVEKVIVVRPLEADDGIIGTWVSAQGEKYEVTTSSYNNYSNWDYTTNAPGSVYNLYYSTETPKVYIINNNSGIIYAKFNDADHIGYGAEVGQWYALYYSELSSSGVKLWQPYKEGGKAACATLEEAVKEYTVDSGYFAASSTCTKE